MASNIDSEFRRFQRTRDPEALAVVFDAAAPRLLLVAMHLCRDAAAAEDLVQTVFLQAIRDVEQFDASRSVMPWLVGILEHRAHDRRERAHVTRERGSRALATVGSFVADPTPGPQSAAEDAELRNQVATALDSVPTKYREVLTLRLVHGLRAVDIAHAQGVSPETVRTKLRRGLAMLRSSLPRGVATASLLTLLATECLRANNGLPGMRRTVLQSIAAPSTAVASALAMKWLWGVGIATAVVIGALLTIDPPDPTLPASNGQAQLPQPAIGAASNTSGEGTASRQLVNAPVTGSKTLPATTVLHGRVVSQQHGQPLTNAKVSMRTYSSPQRGGVPKGWSDPPPVMTDADGVFRFAFVPPPELFVEFKAEAPGFVPDWKSYESLRQGIEVDAGTIALEQGTPVRLRVLVDGKPCPGLEIYANRAKNGVKPSSMHGQDETDQDGHSDFGMCRIGTWYYDIRTQLSGVKEGKFDVPLQANVLTHTVNLTMPSDELTVRGIVVDQFARPVAGLEVQMPSNDGYSYRAATTNADGAFLYSLWQAPDGDPEWTLRLPSKRTDLEWIDSGGKFRWGRNDLHLIVRRRTPGTLRLEVVDAITGAAVEAFGARCIPDPWRKVGSSPQFSVVPPAAHADGIQVFADLRPAPYRVSVFPVAPYAAQTWLSTDIVEGQQSTLRVALMPPAELDVQVVAAGTGQPIADVQVALCRVVPEDRADGLSIDRYRKAFERRESGSYSTGLNVVVLDHASSDKDGTIQLRAAADTLAMALFLTSPYSRDHMIPVPELPQTGATVRVEVEPAGRLTGLLSPPEFVERFGPAPEALAEAARQELVELPKPNRFVDDYPEIELRQVGNSDAVFTAYVDAAGQFAFASLPPATYEVWLSASVRYSRQSSSSRDFGPLATVTVVAGRATEGVNIDASHLVPARATGRFFVDGKIWAGEVGLARLGPDGASKITMITSDGDSRSSPWLTPGRYLPFAHVATGPNDERAIFGLAPITIAPGQDQSFTATLQRRTVAITVHDASGQPLADRRVVPQSLDHPELAFEWRYGKRTDAAGRVVFDPAPVGRLRIMAFPPTQKFGRTYVQPEVLLGEIATTATELAARWPK